MLSLSFPHHAPAPIQGAFCSPAGECWNLLCWELGSRPQSSPGLPEFPILMGKREAAGLRKGHQMWPQDLPGADGGFRV